MSPRDRFAPERAAEEAALAELRALYAEVDARFAGWSCDASTTCCRFGITGREPYVTPIELLALRRALAKTGRKVVSPAPKKGSRRLPIASGGDGSDGKGGRDERRCPLLGEDGRCSVYEARPFGCRTFFCDRASAGEPVRQRDVNAFVQRIRAVSDRLAPGGGVGGEGRPLTRALG